MTVTEVKQASGSWTFRLRAGTPREILDALAYFGHVAIVAGRVSVAEYGDSLLNASRYTGVLQGRQANEDGTTELRGVGMPFWLGDDSRGDVIEDTLTFDNDTFADSLTAVLPAGGSITAGNFHSIVGGYSGSHHLQTPRQAIDYITQLYATEWRVNPNGTLDAGHIADLYRTVPIAVLVKKNTADEVDYRSLSGQMSLDEDTEDYTTRVVLLAEGDGNAIAIGSADAGATPYKDIHGNAIVLTRLISESGTVSVNAAGRAALLLGQFDGERKSIRLSSSDYDVKGSVVVGDYIYVYDEDSGFYDAANEIYYRGEAIHPAALRCVEMSWPVRQGWTVGYKSSANGSWIDLSPYVLFEGGETEIVVGELPRSLSSISFEPIGSRPNADQSIPDAPTFTGFSVGSYQSGETSTTKSAILVQWSQPLNIDGSTIQDGDHYEIQYRVTAVLGYRIKWGILESYKWGTLGKWGAPISDPVVADPEWHTVYAGWGETARTITELTPGVTYEFRIRAVDTTPHFGVWSGTETVTTTGDLFAPSQPAAPTVAASRVALQLVHTLGKASGGTFNLEQDLDHFNVHVGGSADFFPDDSNSVGKLIANGSMINGQIPAVGTFAVEQTDAVWIKVVAVDRSGNKSGASPAVQATVELIDSAHISDLSVSKVTAGTITADWILAGLIRTATSGARAEMDSDGFHLYNSDGLLTSELSAVDGNAQLYVFDPDGSYVKIYNENPGAGAVIEMNPATDPHNIITPARLLSDYVGSASNPVPILYIIGPEWNTADTPYMALTAGNDDTRSSETLMASQVIRLTADDQIVMNGPNSISLYAGASGSSISIDGGTNCFLALRADLAHSASKAGFFSSTPVTKRTVTGARGTNVALANLLTALAQLGLITDSTT